MRKIQISLSSCSVSVTMDALPPLQEVGNVFSCCELCTENRRCHLIILAITLVLMTFDMITDWINWIEWYGVGGYDQYFFASMFETIFLCVAVVSTTLWIMEVIVIIKKWINIYRKDPERKTTAYDQNIFERNKYILEPEVKNYPEDEEEGRSKHSSYELEQESTKYTQPEIRKHIQIDVGNCNAPKVKIKNGSSFGQTTNDKEFPPEPKVTNNKESLSEPEVTNNKKFLSEPEVIENKEFLPEPEVINNKEFLPEPEAINNKEFLPEPEAINNKEFSPELEVTSNKEFPPEPEITNNKEFPPEPEVTSNKEFPPEPEITNNKEFPPEPEITNNKEFPPEPEVTNNKEFPPEPDVTNNKEFPPEPEFTNNKEFPEVIKYHKYTSKNGDEQEEKSSSNRTVNRLRIAVLILAGMLEDFPNVIVIYHTALMPLCGSKTKQEIGSGVTIATIVSSMLNSLWTMICLFFELCSCAKRNPKELILNGEDSDENSVELSQKKQVTKTRDLQKPSKACNTEALEITGKIFVCFVVFVTFTATFIFGFMTLSHVLGFIDLKFTYAGPLNLSTHVITSFYGPGLDAKRDEAMFIYLHYNLSDSHYITLNRSNNRHTKSASFGQVIYRLYIGQFQELSHLRGETLRKAVPCSRDMPFLQNLEELADYTDCKIIFTLRYFPINNNWQPFNNLIHDYHKFITIEYGIHIKDNKTCPYWINQTSSSSFFSEHVKRDILKYSCNSSCGQVGNICENVKSWNIDQRQEMNSTNGSVEQWHLSLAVHDLKTADICDFHLTFEHSNKFCDRSWGEIEHVKVPEEIRNSYPEFITVPITTTWDESRNLRKFNNSCDKLWQNDTFLELDH